MIIFHLPGLCSRPCVTASGTPWLSHNLLILAYLQFKCNTRYVFCCWHSPLFTQGQGVAPPELLVRLSVLVKVGRGHVTPFRPAAEHRDLALLHFQEHSGARRFEICTDKLVNEPGGVTCATFECMGGTAADSLSIQFSLTAE